jgi:hypothetical protein
MSARRRQGMALLNMGRQGTALLHTGRQGMALPDIMPCVNS